MRGCKARKSLSLYPQRPQQLLLKPCSGGTSLQGPTASQTRLFQGLPRLCPGRSPYSYGDAKTPRLLSGSPEPPLSVPCRGGRAAGTREGGEAQPRVPPLLSSPPSPFPGASPSSSLPSEPPRPLGAGGDKGEAGAAALPPALFPPLTPGQEPLGGCGVSPATPRPCFHLHGSPRSSSGAQLRLHPLEMPCSRAMGLGVTSKSKFLSDLGVLFCSGRAASCSDGALGFASWGG